MIIPLQIDQNWDLTWLKLEWLQILRVQTKKIWGKQSANDVFLLGGTGTRIIWRYWIWMDVAVEETRALVSTTPFLIKKTCFLTSNDQWQVYNISRRSGCSCFQLWFLSHESFNFLSYSILFWGLNKEQADSF